MNLRNRSILILFAILVVVMMGFGIIIPVLPLYARSMGATSLHLGLLMATFSIFQFVFAPIWGSLSDRIGRKPVLMIGLVGYAISHITNGVASNIAMLFVSRVMGGILSSATIPTSMALVADVTDEKGRGGGMGILGAAMGMGIIFGPALGGLLSHYSNSFRIPFFAAAASVIVLIPLAWLMLKETLPEAERARHRATHEQNGAATFRMRVEELTSALKGDLAIYFVLTFLVSFAAANLEGVFSFFAMDKFGYGTREIGIMFTVMGVVAVILQGVLVGRSINLLGENRLILIGLATTAIGFYLLTRASGFVPLTGFLVLNMAGGSFVRPCLSSIVSKRTIAGQGATLGLSGSFESLGRVIGPIWAGAIYRLGINLPFLTGAGITVIGLILSLVLLRRSVPVSVSGGNDEPVNAE